MRRLPRMGVAGIVAVLALLAPAPALAHGIGGVKDLPVPGWLFLFGGAVVLVVSFSALGVLWTTPRLDGGRHARPLPRAMQRMLLSRFLRAGLGAISFGLLLLVWVAAAFGSEQPNENLAPTFVYVVFWLGMVPLVVLLGNVWAALNPWRAAADAVAWIAARAGVRGSQFEYPAWLGRWPAVLLLLAFVTLELVYIEPASPRKLAIAIVVYSAVTWSGALLFGRRDWFENADGFSVYFGLLSRLAPFAVRERDGHEEVVVLRPLSRLATPERKPGMVAFIAVMLGSVVFDGFSRSTWWQDRLFNLRAPLIERDPELADLVWMGYSLIGLVAAVLVVALAYLVAVAGAQAVAGREVSFEGAFVGSLIPIALVYAVSHYFTLFLYQGQYAIPLLSDPLGRGSDLLGTIDYQPNVGFLAPNSVWYIQVAVLVAGHVVGLVVAHDRALALIPSAATATRTQYAMLALMVLYTVGGMWLLSLD